MPLEGSVRGAPKPSDVTKSEAVERLREVNMYFSAIGFISDVKKGPFWEHSPMLYDISGIKDGWGKINKGMVKMFNAEVLGKFPVVQHFPFGSLFSWGEDPNAAAPTQSIHLANQPGSVPAAGAGTAAPSAQSARMPATAGSGPDRSTVHPATGRRIRPREERRRAPSLHDEDLPRILSQGVKGTDGAAHFSLTKAPWAK
jgi:serine/threonine-protein phosphatase 2A activator